MSTVAPFLCSELTGSGKNYSFVYLNEQHNEWFVNLLWTFSDKKIY